MAKMSKYEMMIGSTVSMSFADVTVSDYRRLDVVSKTGRNYKKYEVEIDSVLWISTTSFNKQSFARRYFKALEEKINEGKIYTEFGWFTEEEYTRIKDTGKRKNEERTEESMRYWNERAKKQQEPQRQQREMEKQQREIEREIDDLYFYAFTGKKQCEDILRLEEEYFRDFYLSDIVFAASTMVTYGDSKTYFEHVCNKHEKMMNEMLDEYRDNDTYEGVYIITLAKLEEWRHNDDIKKRLFELIENLWRELVEFVTNEFNSYDYDRVDTRVNEYDKVFKDLTPKEAKKKMRELSKQLHPDLHPEFDGTEFKDMHDAYERHMSRVA